MDAAPVKVLLIDDEEASFLILRHILGKVPGRQFAIEWASNYDSGIEALAAAKHDVCLLDYRLGPRDGLDLLRDAASRGLDTPIIMLTGSEDPQVDHEAARLGAWDFLLKDLLDPVSLERGIRYSMQHAETLRALRKSNDRFRLLFERSLDAILISNQRGQIVEANTAACGLLGRPREQLLNLQLPYLPTADPVANGHSAHGLGELSLARPNGERCFIEYSSTGLTADLNLSILRDVTERRKLEGEIQEISEREQRRIGQDLHDGLGQALTGIACLAKVLQQKLQAKNVDEADAAGNITHLIQDALGQTRRISRGLCPVPLEDNDLEAALRLLAENIRRMFSVQCQLRCKPEVKVADNTIAVHLYRIAQEAVTNAIKHGQAKKITMSVTNSKNSLILRIRDDGSGLPERLPKYGGLGLRVMHHRARMMGASLSIQRVDSGGTLVTCALGKSAVAKKSASPRSAARP